MKFHHLLLPALAIAISGCYDNSQNIESKIQKQFSFLGNVETLEYRLASDELYMVKADNEIYFYSTANGAQFVIPAPKAFDVSANKYVDSLISEKHYSFNNIIKNSEIKGIQKFAQVEPSLNREENTQPVVEPAPESSTDEVVSPAPVHEELKTPVSAVKEQEPIPVPAPAPSPAPQSVIKPQSETDAEANKASEAVAAKSIAEGDARLGELRKVLQEKFQAARKLNEAALPNQGQVESQSSTEKSMESVVTPPPKQLVKGDQFTYFNGTPVLKINRNEDGSFATPEKKAESVKKMAEKIPMSWTINFPAIGEEKRQLFVFTDFTCPFCKRLHNDIPTLNQAGITVRYLFYPRSYTAGPDTPSGKLHMDMMRRAWCAPDQGEAMSELFDTKTIDDYKCESAPEAKGRINFPGPYHHFLGTVFGIEGTPTYFTDDGFMDAGYQGYDSFIAKKLKK